MLVHNGGVGAVIEGRDETWERKRGIMRRMRKFQRGIVVINRVNILLHQYVPVAYTSSIKVVSKLS